jgi:hypothetical protein
MNVRAMKEAMVDLARAGDTNNVRYIKHLLIRVGDGTRLATAGYPLLGLRHAKQGIDLSSDGALATVLPYEPEAEVARFDTAGFHAALRAFATCETQ